MPQVSLAHPELLLRVVKFTLAVTLNGLNQYVLDMLDGVRMRLVGALTLLTLMSVLILIPLNSIVLVDHPELRNMVVCFDLLDLALLITSGILVTKQIKVIVAASNSGLVARNQATAVKASAGVNWCCVVFSLFLIIYAFHEIGRNKRKYDCDLKCDPNSNSSKQV